MTLIGHPTAVGSNAQPEMRTPPGTTVNFAWRLESAGWSTTSWQSEARPTGDHGGARIFLKPTLDASLAAEAARHPIGAAAVREIYEPDLETLKGLALMVKVADDPNDPDDAGDPGDNWLWYETFAVAEDGPPTIAERGAPGCVGCHEAGVDLVMPPDPPSPSEG